MQVDEYSRTNVPSIWAVGDVTNRINLTPIALMEGMAFAKSCFGGELTRPDYDFVPSAVFSQPPLASGGCRHGVQMCRAKQRWQHALQCHTTDLLHVNNSTRLLYLQPFAETPNPTPNSSLPPVADPCCFQPLRKYPVSWLH